MSENQTRIVHVVLDEKTFVRRRPEVEHERAVAIYDLIEENHFAPVGFEESGPYLLHLGLEDNRLILDVQSQDGLPLTRFMLPLSPFRTIVKDYFMICESYYTAIKEASPSQIEALDVGRRAMHDEGSELLQRRLADHVKMDHATARRLFTLLCVLHIKG